MTLREQEIADAIDRELKGQPEGAALVNASCAGHCKTCQCFRSNDDTCGDCPACEARADFLWTDCDLCSSGLGGERHAVALIVPGTDTEPVYYSVCTDCMYFVAYGQLDG